MSDMFKALAAPFPPDRVSWRVGSTNADKTKGMALAYLDARDVMDRLDEVCGPGGWSNRYTHADRKTICEIGILVADFGDEFPSLNPQWVWKSDGAGDSDIEAEKGALSDAFKRAAVRWGVGRYLYDLASPWVELETRGRTQIIKESERAKLVALLRRGAPQTDARPAQAPGDPEKTHLFVACKAAIDMADERDRKPGLERWAKDNTASMANMETEYPEVYKAVKLYYAGKLKPYLPTKVAA